VALRNWCERNKNRCYIPEWLLEEWGILWTQTSAGDPWHKNAGARRKGLMADRWHCFFRRNLWLLNGLNQEAGDVIVLRCVSNEEVEIDHDATGDVSAPGVSDQG